MKSQRKPLSEAEAIATLQALADRWPRSLWLYACGRGGFGSLYILRVGDEAHPREGLDQSKIIATIDGIPCDGGDI